MAGIEYPQNEFTRMIEQVSSGNRSGVRGGGVASATPMPTVRSADLGQPVPEETPMTPEERAELDRLAVAAGVKDERLGNTGAVEHVGNYASLDDAIAAGSSVGEPAQVPTVAAPVRYPAREYLASRQTAREFIARTEAPRLPDFRRVEGIDLLRNRVMIDGMEFPIPEDEAAEFKRYAVATAHEAITAKLNEAIGLFAAPETVEVENGGEDSEGESQEVQRDAEGDSA